MTPLHLSPSLLFFLVFQIIPFAISKKASSSEKNEGLSYYSTTMGNLREKLNALSALRRESRIESEADEMDEDKENRQTQIVTTVTAAEDSISNSNEPKSKSSLAPSCCSPNLRKRRSSGRNSGKARSSPKGFLSSTLIDRMAPEPEFPTEINLGELSREDLKAEESGISLPPKIVLSDDGKSATILSDAEFYDIVEKGEDLPELSNYNGDRNASGQKHGSGTYSLKNGDLYFGKFKKDNMCGAGVLHLTGGGVYEGSFADDKMHGKGTFYFPDEFTGSFLGGIDPDEDFDEVEDGVSGSSTGSKSKRTIDASNGDFVLDSRVKWKGRWKNGVASGKGTYTNPRGKSWKGYFSEEMSGIQLPFAKTERL